MKKLSISTLLFLLLACVPFIESRASQPSTEAARELYFKLKGVDGKSYDTRDMRGNVLVVSFGTTWCMPCKEELAALEQLKKEYEGRPVKFIWVNIEGGQEISDKRLREYAKDRRLTLPMLRDTDKSAYTQSAALSPSVMRRAGTPVPLLIFIDREGNVDLPGQLGMTDGYQAQVRGRLDKLLAE